MENTHVYYKTIYSYSNFARKVFRAFVYMLSHWPSLMIYVFTRKNMGERFYTLASAITFIVILNSGFGFKNQYGDYFEVLDKFNWFMGIFMIVFLALAIKRRLEIKRNSNEFDPLKFSYYSGDRYLYDWFLNKIAHSEQMTFLFKGRFFGRHFEACLALAAGLLLLIFPFAKFVALLLLISGLLTILKTNVQYAEGRDFVLTQYDNLIVNDEFADTFVKNKRPKDSRFLDLSMLPRCRDNNINQKLSDIINAQSKKPDKNKPQ